MPKAKGDKENFRVVVEPRSMGDFGSIRMSEGFFYYGEGAQARKEKDYQERCEEIAAEIKRHVDNVRYVSVEYDQETVCEYCGSRWTEKSSTYNGGCCDEDEAHNPEETVA